MEGRDWEDLKKELCKKVDSIKAKGNLGMAEVEVLDKLTHSIKNINKIIDDEEGGYSQKAYSRRGYSRGGDYSRDGMWTAEGNYDYGNSNRGYGRNYSGAVGDDVRQSVRKMMNSGNLSMSDRNALEQVMSMIE
jgi:hypothetical protein